MVQATMNIVKAKMVPMMVQHTSVDFLLRSSTGNWVGYNTFSSNMDYKNEISEINYIDSK